MSAPIQSPEGLGGILPTAPSARTGGARAPTATGATLGPAVAVETTPSSPPAEVLAQVQAAGRVYDRLRSEGITVRFTRDPLGRMRASLYNSEGAPVRDLSPGETVALAAGEGPAR
ncbi:MAG TPA: hypothetical protein VKU89_07155 [Solirubrobacteraceae bacterium]|nr:hypothetical protein [Solirubrobacteraceae bacterium]